MKNAKKILGIMIISSTFFSCAKKAEYETLYKEPGITQISSQYDVNEEYLYLSSTLGTPREVTSASGFYQGSPRIVKINFSETGLEIVEKDAYDQFHNNTNNDSPVMTIPGTFTSYKCAENSLGECGNKEVENTELQWFQKEYFTPEFKDAQVHGVSELQLFGIKTDGCINESGSKLVNYEVKSGVINFELEKTYNINPSFECIQNLFYSEKLRYSSFKARVFHSIVRLKDLATPGYKPFEYSTTDSSTFGFFKTTKTLIDDQYTTMSPDKQQKISFMNRWNPEKGTLVYYLSESFNKPENKIFKDLTYKSIKKINMGLSKADVGFRIELKEPKAGVSSGDLRYNMIVLIDEPLANGLLGYGPSAANPRTGEIIQAHTNMYSGVLKSTLQYVWENMVDLQNSEILERNTERTAPVVHSEVETAETHELHEDNHHEDEHTNYANESFENILKEDPYRAKIIYDNFKIAQKEKLKMPNTKKGVSELPLSKLDTLMKEEGKRLDNLSKNNAYAVEFLSVKRTVKKIFPEILEISGLTKGSGQLKSWSDLSRDQRKMVENIILPYIYSSTLVHEFGHNLGLRHNFSGNVDVNNFYTKEESQGLGLDFIPESSSTMDYAGTNFGELNVYGKYDISALRYGYAQKIETVDGDIIKLNKTISEHKKEVSAKLMKQKMTLSRFSSLNEEERNLALEKEKRSFGIPKEFDYCTDENVGTSVLCNRFDDGKNILEITKNRIDTYNRMYKRRNFRNDKTSFDTYGIGGYLMARYREFNQIRSAYEQWKVYASFYGTELLAKGCPTEAAKAYPVICNDLKMINDAAVLSADFFLDVLKTPNKTCLIEVSRENRSTRKIEIIKQIVTLESLYSEIKYQIGHFPETCFDPFIIEHYSYRNTKVIGENGKFLNGIKDTNPEFAYASDLYVRGIWADKILAMKSLTQRFSEETTSSGNMNYEDHPVLKEKIKTFITNYMMEIPLSDAIPFQDSFGKNVKKATYSLNIDDVIYSNNVPSSWIKDFFQIPENENANLLEVILKNASFFETLAAGKNNVKARKNANYYSVIKEDILRPMNKLDTIQSIMIDNKVYTGIQGETQLAYEMILKINTDHLLDGMDKELIFNNYKKRMDDFSKLEKEEEKLAFKLDPSIIKLVMVLRETNKEVWTDQSKVIKELNLPSKVVKDIISIQGLNLEELKKVYTLITPSVDSSEDEKILYTLTTDELLAFQNGSSKVIVDKYLKILPLLPEAK